MTAYINCSEYSGNEYEKYVLLVELCGKCLGFFVSIGITSSMYSFGGTCICSNHWMFSLALERVNYEGYSVDFEIAPNVNI